MPWKPAGFSKKHRILRLLQAKAEEPEAVRRAWFERVLGGRHWTAGNVYSALAKEPELKEKFLLGRQSHRQMATSEILASDAEVQARVARILGSADSPDHKAWKILHEFRPFVFAQAVRWLGSGRRTMNAYDVDDLVQEVLLRTSRGGAIQKWIAGNEHYDFSSPDKVKSYLASACHRTFVNLWRKGHRMRQVEITDDLQPGRPSAPLVGQRETVLKRLSELKPDFAKPLYLFSVWGCSYEEIAGILGIPGGTVMSRMHRARTQIIELYPTVETFLDARSKGTVSGAWARQADELDAKARAFFGIGDEEASRAPAPSGSKRRRR